VFCRILASRRRKLRLGQPNLPRQSIDFTQHLTQTVKHFVFHSTCPQANSPLQITRFES
jgi:hypothetical protein